MVEERAFNIFVYFDQGVARQYGARHHRLAGDDEAKLRHLRANIETDHAKAKRFDFGRTFTPEEWIAAQRFSEVTRYFEEAFSNYRAPRAVVYCMTPVVDGVPTFDEQVSTGPFRGDVVTQIEGRGSVPDYLVTYVRENTFHLAELLNDDYFKAIKLLFNAGHHVSSAKLLMSCVDTLAFVEHGDRRGNFTDWLDAYVDLAPIGITAVEVWEFRNSILHMTNLASRQVLAGKVSSISPYIGSAHTMPRLDPRLPKPFNLYRLMLAVGGGAGKWAQTYADTEKMLKFIERYDTTISDGRVARWQSTSSDPEIQL
ncbi:hypothetical protein [Rhizobium laguerreae]|uniref:hypothetical protein n=1 Tax=Rhizobium laguerreae TaxID=1076926 RepID=UPI001C8FAA07|nr:hypothetical protein [Rhizobium laguerreae]MBY3389201.1 hypothetical protein [Rhizobium laguerreae]MBY3402952.1 hypothetical protein [Rhizobium laguerreae]MBY3409891.1 hypothetical protein [Rhizobium laguerreae]